MVKKGGYRTIEAVLAGILLVVIVLLVTRPTPTNSELQEVDLHELSQDSEFRQCVIDRNFTCVDAMIAPYMSGYEYAAEDPSKQPKDRAVNVYAVFIAANDTDYVPSEVKIFYWQG